MTVFKIKKKYVCSYFVGERLRRSVDGVYWHPALKYLRSGALYRDLEPPSPILTLGVNPFPYIFIFRTDLLRFLPGVFAPLHQLLHSDPLLLRKRCDLQNNNGEKRGGEFAQHAVHRRNNIFAGNLFLEIKRFGKGLTQGLYSADGGSG